MNITKRIAHVEINNYIWIIIWQKLINNILSKYVLNKGYQVFNYKEHLFIFIGGKITKPFYIFFNIYVLHDKWLKD